MHSARLAEGYTDESPSGRGQYTQSNPPVELHLRNELAPTLPPQTHKHTTHPTWYVFSFILFTHLVFTYDRFAHLQLVLLLWFCFMCLLLTEKEQTLRAQRRKTPAMRR